MIEITCFKFWFALIYVIKPWNKRMAAVLLRNKTEWEGIAQNLRCNKYKWAHREYFLRSPVHQMNS